MKINASAVLVVVTATSADAGHTNHRALWGCPPPQGPPPPPREDGGVWIWVCHSNPSSGGGPPNDDGNSYDDEGKWVDDSTAKDEVNLVEETDDGKWGGDGGVSEEVEVASDDATAGDDAKWGGDGYGAEETDDGTDDSSKEDDGKWSDDGYTAEETDDAGDDGAVDDGGKWAGDGNVDEETDDAAKDDGTWGDDGFADDGKMVDDANGEKENWNGDGHGEEIVGNHTVGELDDDGKSERGPTQVSESTEADYQQQETKAVPVGAISGAVAAAGAVAALLALVVSRLRRERFVDGEEKDSIGTDEDNFIRAPSSKDKMATDDDIEIDHTFFDENLFNANYQEQEMQYQDDDLSTINEDSRYRGDDASV